jgi:hypothetical protein
LWFVGLAAHNSARAQNVVNPNFSLPSAGANGIIEDPTTTPQIGWTFSKTGPNSTSGVQANGSAFNAPTAPDGQPQTAYINNLNSISQNIEFKLPGDYELSFQIAEYPHGTPSGTTQSVAVFIGGQKKGTYKPQSSTSFNQVQPIPFEVATANSSVELKFVGYGPGSGGQLLPGEATAVFIAAVVIKPVVPQITTSTCPTDIDPTSSIKNLSVANFGSGPGKILIHFPTPSKVKFKNSDPMHPYEDLYLDVPAGQSGGTITSKALDEASPIGAPPAQTVDIYVIGANGQQSSNACHPKFNNKPVITDVSPGSITPNQSFNISGWDFGDDPGKVTIHFTNNSYPHDDVDAQINKYTSGSNSGKPEWQPWVIGATVPKNVVGVIEQDVDINVTPKGGSASNSWKETFKPRMVMELAPSVFVQKCGNSTSLDLCNPSYGSYTGGGVCMLLDAFGTAGALTNSIFGMHESCAWTSSDNGQDEYWALVFSPWTITKVEDEDDPPLSPPGVWGSCCDNATIEYGYSPAVPSTNFVGTVIVTVNWHIGATGGEASYWFNVYAEGPAGISPQQ